MWRRTVLISINISLITLAAAGCRPAAVPSGEVFTPPPVEQPTLAPAIQITLLQPGDLQYTGAFRLPEYDEVGWNYGGDALAYYPGGDPDGPDDGFPGSLFGTGHDWYQEVSEISIPQPIIADDVSALNRAKTLQDFANIRGNLYPTLDFEIPRAGLEILGDQLYFCWGQHYQESPSPSHGWASLDLSNPDPVGAWYIGEYSNYATNDYMFSIPQDWQASHAPGMQLATGRFRDGGWSGQGPALFAFNPTPPAGGSRLDAVPLLLYDDSYEEGGPTMDNYHHSDEWSGGAWLTAGDRSAVVFAGTKGTGAYWYGFANGVTWPDEAPYPPIPPPPNDDRGWWSTAFEGQILFYNPADLASVAQGDMAAYDPQPYAVLKVDDFLLGVESDQQKHHLGAAAFDRERGYLYIFEPLADGDQPVIHVWKVG